MIKGRVACSSNGGVMCTGKMVCVEACTHLTNGFCDRGRFFTDDQLAARDKERDAANVEAGARAMRDDAANLIEPRMDLDERFRVEMTEAIRALPLPTSTLPDLMRKTRVEALEEAATIATNEADRRDKSGDEEMQESAGALYGVAAVYRAIIEREEG